MLCVYVSEVVMYRNGVKIVRLYLICILRILNNVTCLKCFKYGTINKEKCLAEIKREALRERERLSEKERRRLLVFSVEKRGNRKKKEGLRERE